MGMLFYLSEGTEVSGPHAVGELRRRLAEGRMSLDSQVCARGSDTWMPARGCGALLEKAVGRSGVVCGGCGSEEVQRLKVIYEGGVSHSVSKGTTAGAVLDFSDGGGMMPVVMGTRTQTSSATMLATRCAPPVWENFRPVSYAREWMLGMVVLLLATAFLGLMYHVNALRGVWVLLCGGAAMGCLAMAIFGGASAKEQRRAKGYFHRALGEWEGRFYCHRCGWMGEPVKEEG